MKIYTKTGDKGKTSLFTGKRVSKHDLRIESYGTVDELNSYIGLIKDHAPEGEDLSLMHRIQDRLFTIGSILATEPEKKGDQRFKTPEISEEDITVLEKSMDRMNNELPEMTHFVLPGGHPTVSFCHVGRTICRRAERRITELHEQTPVEEKVIKYINRLSDYLFVLARYWGQKVKANEVKWIPEK
jgi:cob(I)alamin adenosyltransferase